MQCHACHSEGQSSRGKEPIRGGGHDDVRCAAPNWPGCSGSGTALPGRRRSPDYAALAGAVRGLLADGRLPLGVRLPAERELAEALRISRTTVTAAYRELRETGHLTSRRGAGSWTTLPGGHRVASSGLWTPEDDLDMIDLGVRRAGRARRAGAGRPGRRRGPAALPGRRRLPPDRHRSSCARRSPPRTPPAACPPAPSRSWSPAAPSTPSTWCCGSSVPAGGAVLVESPTYPNALAALAAPPGPDHHPRPGRRRPAGTPSCCSARCGRPGPGWRT